MALKRKIWFLTSGIILGAVIVYVATHKKVPVLTREALTNAILLWKSSHPKDYTLEIHVTGVQEGEHLVEVQESQVVRMETGGRPAAEHLWEQWKTEGLFEFLQMEILNKEHSQRVYGIEDKSHIHLSAEFDPTYGYPRYFLRQIFGKEQTIEWHVVLKPTK